MYPVGAYDFRGGQPPSRTTALFNTCALFGSDVPVTSRTFGQRNVLRCALLAPLSWGRRVAAISKDSFSLPTGNIR